MLLSAPCSLQCATPSPWSRKQTNSHSLKFSLQNWKKKIRQFSYELVDRDLCVSKLSEKFYNTITMEKTAEISQTPALGWWRLWATYTGFSFLQFRWDFLSCSHKISTTQLSTQQEHRQRSQRPRARSATNCEGSKPAATNHKKEASYPPTYLPTYLLTYLPTHLTTGGNHKKVPSYSFENQLAFLGLI